MILAIISWLAKKLAASEEEIFSIGSDKDAIRN
jgi:hypothetical protein